MHFIFQGRPDGLGNRIEELIVLEAYCEKNNTKATYIWRNKPHYFKGQLIPRSYEIFLNLKYVEITTKLNFNGDLIQFNQIKEGFSQNDFLKAAKNIKPNFDIQFNDGVKPLGIHLRGTDRINKDMKHPHFMKSEKEFEDLICRTIDYVNKQRPNYLFICSDDEQYKHRILNQIDCRIQVVEPISRENVPAEYIDFFGLTLCQEVVMCSKFSTFAITASLIGNIPLISFYKDEDVKSRYKALMNYQLKSFKQKIIDIFKVF